MGGISMADSGRGGGGGKRGGEGKGAHMGGMSMAGSLGKATLHQHEYLHSNRCRLPPTENDDSDLVPPPPQYEYLDLNPLYQYE